MALVLALALACSPSCSSQEGAAPSAVEPAHYTLEALIARLPPVGSEWSFQGEARSLHPIAAEFSRRLQAGVVLTSEQWRDALLGTGALRTRPRWPAGEPFAVSVRNPAWIETGTVLILDPPPDLGLCRARVGTSDLGLCAVPLVAQEQELAHQELGVLSLGHHELPFRLELWRADVLPGFLPWFSDYLVRKEGSERGIPNLSGGLPRLPPILSTSELMLHVEIVADMSDAIPAVSTPELDRTVRRTLSLELDSYSKEGVLMSSWVEGLEGVGLSLDVEVFMGNDLRERDHLLADEEVWSKGWPTKATGVYLEALTAVILGDPAARSSWRIRVRGTDTDLLRSWSIDRRWSGTLELSIDELIGPGELEER